MRRTGARTCDVTASPPVPCYVIRFVDVYRLGLKPFCCCQTRANNFIKDNLKKRKVHIHRTQFSDDRIHTSYTSQTPEQMHLSVTRLQNSYLLQFPDCGTHYSSWTPVNTFAIPRLRNSPILQFLDSESHTSYSFQTVEHIAVPRLHHTHILQLLDSRIHASYSS